MISDEIVVGEKANVFFLDNKEQGLALLIYKQKRVSFVLLAANFICKVEN